MVSGSTEATFAVPANSEEAWELVDLDFIVEGAEANGVLFLLCDG